VKGNLTSAGSTTYAYSSENLLTSATGGIATAYDPAMRLYQTSDASAGTTRFGYDGAALIAEYNGSNALLRRYVHGPGSDEPLVWYEGSGTSDRRFLHSDERGSVVAVTNSAGTTLNVNGYNEYGIPSSGNVGRFQYTGQTWLPELGMYYYKARIYSPTLGRFLQPDPIGYGGGMNLYAYVGGDPVNFTDPLGLKADDDDDDGCGKVVRELCPIINGGRGSGTASGGGGAGFGGTPAVLLPYDGPALTGDPAVCANTACDEIIVTRVIGNQPWYFNGRSYVLNRRRVEPWYGKYMELGFVLGPPLIALGAAVAPEVIAVEGPRRALFQYGRGRLIQMRFGKDALKIRVDVRKPITHVNIETPSKNIHWPKW
jgi:RHS repeat-associated protein